MSAASLVIDIGLMPDSESTGNHGTVTLFGVTALGAADIDATTRPGFQY